MEASSSQPAAGAGSGDAGRPINPATQRPVRQHDEPEKTKETPEKFDVSDLRRWEDARLSEFDEKLANLSAVLEGQQEELRGVLRNELMIALVTLLVAGGVFVLTKEISKMKETTVNETE
jgi:hypothetical protein